MGSNTKQPKFRRNLRKKNAGKVNKRARRKGTTPAFPVHTEAADKNAPEQAKKSE